MVLKVYGVPLRLKCCLILPLISVMYEIRPIKWFCKVLQSSNCALEWRKSSIAMECWAITTSINQTCPEKDLRAPFWNIPKISFLCSTWDVRPPSKVLVWDIPARSFFVSLGMFLELKWDVPGSSRTPRWDIPGTYLGCMCVVWEVFVGNGCACVWPSAWLNLALFIKPRKNRLLCTFRLNFWCVLRFIFRVPSINPWVYTLCCIVGYFPERDHVADNPGKRWRFTACRLRSFQAFIVC